MGRTGKSSDQLADQTRSGTLRCPIPTPGSRQSASRAIPARRWVWRRWSIYTLGTGFIALRILKESDLGEGGGDDSGNGFRAFFLFCPKTAMPSMPACGRSLHLNGHPGGERRLRTSLGQSRRVTLDDSATFPANPRRRQPKRPGHPAEELSQLGFLNWRFFVRRSPKFETDDGSGWGQGIATSVGPWARLGRQVCLASRYNRARPSSEKFSTTTFFLRFCGGTALPDGGVGPPEGGASSLPGNSRARWEPVVDLDKPITFTNRKARPPSTFTRGPTRRRGFSRAIRGVFLEERLMRVGPTPKYLGPGRGIATGFFFRQTKLPADAG